MVPFCGTYCLTIIQLIIAHPAVQDDSNPRFPLHQPPQGKSSITWHPYKSIAKQVTHGQAESPKERKADFFAVALFSG